MTGQQRKDVDTLTAAGFSWGGVSEAGAVFEKPLADGRILVVGTADGDWGADVFASEAAREDGIGEPFPHGYATPGELIAALAAAGLS